MWASIGLLRPTTHCLFWSKLPTLKIRGKREPFPTKPCQAKKIFQNGTNLSHWHLLLSQIEFHEVFSKLQLFHRSNFLRDFIRCKLDLKRRRKICRGLFAIFRENACLWFNEQIYHNMAKLGEGPTHHSWTPYFRSRIRQFRSVGRTLDVIRHGLQFIIAKTAKEFASRH